MTAIEQHASGVRDPANCWNVALCSEQRAGEMRLNLIRLVAIALFYGNHLISYYLRDMQLTREFHLSVTGIAAAWASAALIIHLVLARYNCPYFLKYSALGWDTFMATSLILLTGGPQSVFLVLLLLILITSPIRMHLPLVWVACGAVLVSYGVACGHSRWVRPETMVPTWHHVVYLVALLTTGLLAGQTVRQSLRFALDYADRRMATRSPDGHASFPVGSSPAEASHGAGAAQESGEKG